MQLASSTITRWWWAPDRCREQDQELLAVVQERFHSAANNRPPACSGPSDLCGTWGMDSSLILLDSQTGLGERQIERLEQQTEHSLKFVHQSYKIHTVTEPYHA